MPQGALLVPIFLKVESGDSNAEIGHLVIQGSTQWVIGGNILSFCTIDHAADRIMLPDSSALPMCKDGYLSYISRRLFWITSDPENAKYTPNIAWSHTSSLITSGRTIAIVDKVHKHTRGHSTYSDMVTLLQRNQIWDESVEAYLRDVISRCGPCRPAIPTKPMRKVSISGSTNPFNTTVQVGHLFLDGKPILHIMEHPHRYSIGIPVESTSVNTAIELIESRWLAEFWAPQYLKFDRAFDCIEFRKFLNDNDIEPQLIPARRHNKLALESKHKILRDIYIRLRKANPQESFHRLCTRTFMISNDLYGNGTLSVYESVKGYTRPVDPKVSPINVPQEIKTAQEEIIAKRKLNLILRSKALHMPALDVGDVVEV